MPVVCVYSEPNCCGTKQWSASQPVSCLLRLSANLCHLAEGAYTNTVVVREC